MPPSAGSTNWRIGHAIHAFACLGHGCLWAFPGPGFSNIARAACLRCASQYCRLGGRPWAHVSLLSDGDGALSGALCVLGAYVLTGTSLRLFPHGQTTAASAPE